MKQVMVAVPDLNKNAEIEAFATKIGAYSGAGITAFVGGVLHGVLGLGRGAMMGAQVTHANVGTTPAVIENKSVAAQVDPEKSKFVFYNGKLCVMDVATGSIRPYTRSNDPGNQSVYSTQPAMA